MTFDKFMDDHFDIASIALVATTLLLGFSIDRVAGYKTKVSEGERLKSMPDSYWAAKAVEAEASVKKHELDIQSQERLVIDKRDRAAKKEAAQREFEKSAPPEYWAAMAKKAEIEERGRTERENAQAQAKALENAAMQLRYAVS